MIKLSARLQSCADLVRQGNAAADVGTDHGYLAIYLLQQGICPHVIASDLRPGPLDAARRSAERENISAALELILSDGLHNINTAEIQTVICAGMGGDTIISILEEEPLVRRREMQLVLQPQSKNADLRRWLGQNGFLIVRERLSRDGKFLYTAMEVCWDGAIRTISPGEALMPKHLLQSGDPLTKEYFQRVINRVSRTVDGLHKAKEPDPDQLRYYETALEELRRMEETL